jgi:hypothetical protein
MTSNKFAILQNQLENPTTLANPNVPLPGIVPQSTSQGIERPSQGKDFDISPLDTTQDPQGLQEIEDGEADMELEEQDLAVVDLEHLEHAYRQQKLYTIPRDQLTKVHKVFLNSLSGSSARASKALGIHGSQSKNPNKT